MKVDIINSQVNRFVFPIAHDMIVLASDRLRFLNLGCVTGHLSFEMSCSFTVQVPAQLDLLKKVTSIKAFKNDFQLLPKELDTGALDGEELLPIELLECGTTPAGALDGEELLVVELLEFGTNPAGALEVEVTSPSFKRVASKSAGSTASPTPPSPQGTTASTTPPFVRAGYDCQNNTTVRRRPEAVGWAPSVLAGPLTTSFGTVGQWERRHRAMVERTKGRRPKNRPCVTKGRRPKNRPAKGGTLEATWGRGEGTREPWRRGATYFCKLSRQLLVGLNEHG